MMVGKVCYTAAPNRCRSRSKLQPFLTMPGITVHPVRCASGCALSCDNWIHWQTETISIHTKGGKQLMLEFIKNHNSLFCYLDYEVLQIEPWGRDSVRVRAT